SWGGGRVRATAIELEPLPPEESALLIEALTAELELPIDTATVLAKTEGNPLFVEETIRMLAERPRAGSERIPDTLQALIAARIDRLPSAERTLLQRAAAMGRIFMLGALEQLGHRALSREAFRSARKLLLRAAELAPTLNRRYLAARAAWRLGDMTAVVVEMEEVASASASAGEHKLHGRALTALAEATL